MKKFLLVVTFLAATCQLMIAQGQAVSGKITDETGTGLPGANIVVKGTTNGAISDADGQFSLTGVSPESVLQISSIGYTTQEVTVGTQTSINVQMVLDVVQLSEVVVVGYGNQERSMVTSAVSSVKAETLKDLPVTSIDQRLQGQLAGVQINQSTATPGGGSIVRIRGAGSLSTQNGANDPLYVIDGFPVTNTFNAGQNPLATINPDDIESITVLKDAASTSIYGSRGANGVILINTKRAKAGQSSIEVSMYVGLQNIPEDRKLKIMNAQEYAQYRLEQAQDRAAQRVADGVAGAVPFDIRMVHPSYRYPEKGGAEGGTDWMSIVNKKTAPISNYNVTVSKGTENLRTLLSLGYFNQEGNIITTGIERYSMRANVDGNVSKNITIGLNLSPSYTVRKGPNVNGLGSGATSFYGQGLNAYPTESPYAGTWDDEGNFTRDVPNRLASYLRPFTAQYVATTPQGTGFTQATPANYTTVYPAQGTNIRNPLNVVQNSRFRTYNIRALANTYVTWQIIPGLTAKATLNLDLRQDKADEFRGSVADVNWTPATPYPNQFSAGANNNTNTYNWLNENTLDYNKTFGDHRLSVLAGYTTQVERSEAVNMTGAQYINDALWTIQNASVITGTHEVNEWRMVSLLGRINYSFGDRYVVGATVRRDGSSRFGVENRYATFPSFSAAWIASNESFFPQNNLLTEVKLRASWGKAGSNAIGNYGSYTSIATSNFYNLNNAVVPAATIGALANPTLTWEESAQTDIGLDLQFFDGRISLVTELYERLTINMLQGVNVPWVSGFATVNDNQGEIRNRGMEFTLSTKNSVGAIKWNTDLNLSMNRNMVLDLGSSLATFNGPSILAVGQPMGEFWANVRNGFVTQEELNSITPSHPSYVGPVGTPGRVAVVDGTAFVGAQKYVDFNTASDVPGTSSGLDGRITNNDRIRYASPYPNFTLGITNSVRYKNFDLSVVVAASQGAKIFAQYKFFTTNLDGSWNVEKEVKNRFRYVSQEETSDALYQTTNGNTQFARDSWYPTTYFYDASYINFKNITLGYSLKIKATSLRVYLSGQNVFLITKYPGGNPEVSQPVGPAATATSNANNPRTPNVDAAGSPLAAAYTLGANFKF